MASALSSYVRALRSAPVLHPSSFIPASTFPHAAAAWLAAFDALDAGRPVGPFAPATLKQVLSSALDLGRAAGRLPHAMRVLAEFELRLRRLAATLRIDRRAGTVAGGTPPRVVVITELRGDGVVLAGRWVPDLAAAAGALALLVDAGGPDVAAPLEDIVAADPDRLVFSLRDRAVDDALPVVREAIGRAAPPGRGGGVADRCSVLDGSRFVNKPGPELARSIELIALACHGIACGVRAAPDEIVALDPTPAVGIDDRPA